MTKNTIAFALCAVFLALSFSAEAQQLPKVPRIGVLVPGTATAYSSQVEAFQQGLRALGYIEGQNIAIEYRYGEAEADSLPALAAELVRLKVDVIVTSSTPAIRAARQATNNIPIIVASAGDFAREGFIVSFARPGGNITGLSFMGPELSGKRLELLKESFPRISSVAFLRHSTGGKSTRDATKATAQSLGLHFQILEVRSPDDLDSAFGTAKRDRAGGLVTSSDPFLFTHRKRVLDLAVSSRLPVIYPRSEFAVAGGLMAYSMSFPDLWRRAATYVDRVLKGIRPADLPVERPTKFELVINLKTAKQLGLTIPQSVLYRADRVIK